MTAKQYKVYPKYKDSGVEWLGVIPENWGVEKFKYNTSVLNGNGFPIEEQGKDEGDYPFLKVSDINTNCIFVDKVNNYVSAETVINKRWNLIPKNAIVMGKIGAASLLNHRKLTKQESLIDNNMMAITIKNEEISYLNYLYYLTKLIDMKDFINMGAIPAVNIELLKNYKITFPPLSEQEKVAEFLDAKVGHIDRLVSKLEEQLKLIDEQRNSLITETVCKGLNPKAPMKDSGIEWLGKIPAHWRIKKLKYLAKIENGKDYKDLITYDDTIVSYPIYGSGGEFCRCIQYIHNKPSVLLGRKGTINKPLYVTEPFWTVDTMYFTNVFDTIKTKYLYFLTTTIEYGYFQYGSAIPSMNKHDLENIKFPYPSLSEQKEIVEYLNEKLSKIDTLKSKTIKQVELLKEYKTSLITNVVTGKIDVRNEVI